MIGKGGHTSTPRRSATRRSPCSRRWLKDGKGLAVADVEEPDRKLPIEALKVLEPKKPLPANVNDSVHESFASAPPRAEPPESASEWESLKANWRRRLKPRSSRVGPRSQRRAA